MLEWIMLSEVSRSVEYERVGRKLILTLQSDARCSQNVCKDCLADSACPQIPALALFLKPIALFEKGKTIPLSTNMLGFRAGEATSIQNGILIESRAFLLRIVLLFNIYQIQTGRCLFIRLDFFSLFSHKFISIINAVIKRKVMMGKKRFMCADGWAGWRKKERAGFTSDIKQMAI